jgi:hypothetical protein
MSDTEPKIEVPRPATIGEFLGMFPNYNPSDDIDERLYDLKDWLEPEDYKSLLAEPFNEDFFEELIEIIRENVRYVLSITTGEKAYNRRSTSGHSAIEQLLAAAKNLGLMVGPEEYAKPISITEIAAQLGQVSLTDVDGETFVKPVETQEPIS